MENALGLVMTGGGARGAYLHREHEGAPPYKFLAQTDDGTRHIIVKPSENRLPPSSDPKFETPPVRGRRDRQSYHQRHVRHSNCNTNQRTIARAKRSRMNTPEDHSQVNHSPNRTREDDSTRYRTKNPDRIVQQQKEVNPLPDRHIVLAQAGGL